MEGLAETFDFTGAAERLKDVVNKTPLIFHAGLSKQYNAKVYLKREDLQIVRSYKLRGAYNKISTLSPETLKKGVVCASAGNHAQGVAYSCNKLKIRGIIFMPEITPKQKIRQTEMFGDGHIEIKLAGDTFDDCLNEALKYASENEMAFIPPFDDNKIIEGQGTVGVEILDELPEVDVVVVPLGGGGLASGIGLFLKGRKSEVALIGVEPAGAPSMLEAFNHGKPSSLDQIDKFVDGAAVKRVGNLTHKYCSELLDGLKLVSEGRICTLILKLYDEDAIVIEPAGALAVAALEQLTNEIEGKTVVCIISGGNNDIERMQEIKEKSLLYEGLKHYFIVRFPQRPGALRRFVNDALGPHDDITRFEFIKKTERESGPALVGIELKNKQDYIALCERLRKFKFDFVEINNDKTLFEYLV